jgi:hypothetical protein
MDIYVKKRTLHIFFVVLLLLAASVTIVAAQQQQKLKQSAQTSSSSAQLGYKEPPLYGCLQVGEGTNKGCASKLLKADLKVTLRGENAEGRTVFYNESLTAVLTVTNVGDLPIILKTLAVTGHPLNAKYKVDFQPQKQNITINPKQQVVLTDAVHKFNSPDPGGQWKITGTAVDQNGQTVTDVASVNVNVDTTCLALLRVQFTPAQVAQYTKTCKADKTAAGCNEFCIIYRTCQ